MTVFYLLIYYSVYICIKYIIYKYYYYIFTILKDINIDTKNRRVIKKLSLIEKTLIEKEIKVLEEAKIERGDIQGCKLTTNTIYLYTEFSLK